MFEYYKGLIAFRKAHAALRLTNAEDVKNNVIPISGMDANVAAFQINGGVNGETANSIFVIFNANKEGVQVELPQGKWNMYINGEKAGTEVIQTIKNGKVTVDGLSALVLAQDNNSAKGNSSPVLLIVSIAAVVVMAACAGVVLMGKKKAKKK